MAEKKAESIAPVVEAAAPQGGKPILFIALAVINMLVVVGVGVMIYINKQKEKAANPIEAVIAGEDDTRKKEKENIGVIGKLVVLEQFLVNLSGSNGNRLAKINMELEVNNDDVAKEIDKLKPKIRDIIIIIVSSKNYAQVSSKEGKDALREEIRDHVNLFLTKGQINRVYFTEFLYN